MTENRDNVATLPNRPQTAAQPSPQPADFSQPDFSQAPASGRITPTDTRPLFPFVATVMGCAIVAILIFQQIQIAQLYQQQAGIKSEVTDIRNDLNTTSLHANAALTAIRQQREREQKLCTIPLIGGWICDALGIPKPAAAN